MQPIHAAAEHGTIDKLSILLEAGASVNATSDIKETPLMSAAEGNMAQNIKFLHQHRGDLNDQNEDGQTALHYAFEHDHVESVSMLLNLGAKADVRDNRGKLPMDIAEEKKSNALCEILQKLSLK